MHWKFWEPDLTPKELAERERHARVVRTNDVRIEFKFRRDEEVRARNHLAENVKKAMGG